MARKTILPPNPNWSQKDSDDSWMKNIVGRQLDNVRYVSKNGLVQLPDSVMHTLRIASGSYVRFFIVDHECRIMKA